jgi:hypothetical protein
VGFQDAEGAEMKPSERIREIAAARVLRFRAQMAPEAARIAAHVDELYGPRPVELGDVIAYLDELNSDDAGAAQILADLAVFEAEAKKELK